MTVIEIELPDATAKAARDAGLLAPAAIEQMLLAAMRRQAAERFLSLSDDVAAAGIPEMSMDQINAEVKAVWRLKLAAAALSEPALDSIWSNQEDAVYDVI